MPFKPASYPGTLHHFTPRLVAFEYASEPATTSSHAPPHHFLLFLGGLTDALRSVSYPEKLSRKLPPTFCLAEVTLSSSGNGWTTSSLARDADELSEAVGFFRQLSSQRNPGGSPGKIILLGHSTGSQIALTYVIGSRNQDPSSSNPPAERPAVDAIMLQAGISDREGVEDALGKSQANASLDLAKSMLADGRGHDHLPLSATDGIFGGKGMSQPSAERWISLVAEDGDDDLFSSDLSDRVVERVWGRDGGLASKGTPALVLWGAEDEHVPKAVDKSGTLRRWADCVRRRGGVWHQSSGVVPSATHNLNASPASASDDLCERMVRFAGEVADGQLV